MRGRLAEPRLALVDRVVAAIGRLQVLDEAAHFAGDRRELARIGILLGHVPQAHGHVRHGEMVEEVEVERIEHGVEAGRVDEPARQAVDLLADGVVLLAELDQLAQLVLEQLRLLAHRHQLALADRHRAPAVGVRNLQVHQEIDVVLEEPGVLPQEFGDLFSAQQR